MLTREEGMVPKETESKEEKSDCCAETRWRETLWRLPLIRLWWGQGSSTETARTDCPAESFLSAAETGEQTRVDRFTLWAHVGAPAVILTPDRRGHSARAKKPPCSFRRTRLERTAELLGTTQSATVQFARQSMQIKQLTSPEKRRELLVPLWSWLCYFAC